MDFYAVLMNLEVRKSTNHIEYTKNYEEIFEAECYLRYFNFIKQISSA